MSLWNRSTRRSTAKPNHEQAPAYKLDPKLELYTLACTMTVDDKFYESRSAQLTRLRSLIARTGSDFAVKLAVYVRDEMHLRSVAAVLIVEAARYESTPIIAPALTRIIQRADDITELLAYYQRANGRTERKKLGSLSKQLQKGIARAFGRFDEYQFAKYDRVGEITLKDALFLTHPKPGDDARAALYGRIASGTLRTPKTWETELSVRGNTAEVWEALVSARKLGYMAMLRNLRNIITSGVSSECIRVIAAVLADKEKVAFSKQLPIRFLSAYREISALPDSEARTCIREALETAVGHSITAMDFFRGQRVLLASDVSGSMLKPISARSSVELYDIGLLFSMLLMNAQGIEATAGYFGEQWKVKSLPRTQVLENVLTLRAAEGEVGYATNGFKVLEWALKQRRQFDRILFFTDCQMYNSGNDGTPISTLWQRYRMEYPQARVYFFNLAGYDTVPLSVNGAGVYTIAGFSDRIFDMLARIESGDSAISVIEAIDVTKGCAA